LTGNKSRLLSFN